MNEKLERLLNHIGINEDYLEFFKNSSIEKIIIDKKTNSFNFYLKMDNIPSFDVYQDMYNCLAHEFNKKIQLFIIYDELNYQNISSYLNNIIKEYAKESIRYNVFIDREIEVINNQVNFKVYNKIEEIQQKYINEIVTMN